MNDKMISELRIAKDPEGNGHGLTCDIMSLIWRD
jgi:hypothetical protein